MTKKYIKISKGELSESKPGGQVFEGETVIDPGHWGKLTAKRTEKELISVLKADDKRAKKEAKA